MRMDFESKARSGMHVLFTILAVTIVGFLMIPNGSSVFNEMALSSFGIKSLKLWEPVTYMLLHGNFIHILVNMWGLYLFGSIIAPELGGQRFLSLYLISGITGGLCWILFNWNSPFPVIGASGAIFGLLLATAMLYPNKEFLLLFFPFPIKTKTMVIVYAIIEIVSMPGQSNIAHLAHLGGFVGAYIYIKSLYGKNLPWDIFGSAKKSFGGASNPPPGWRMNNYTQGASSDDSKFVSRSELDRLLDKISEKGINSLTDEEHAALKRAREQMKDKS